MMELKVRPEIPDHREQQVRKVLKDQQAIQEHKV